MPRKKSNSFCSVALVTSFLAVKAAFSPFPLRRSGPASVRYAFFMDEPESLPVGGSVAFFMDEQEDDDSASHANSLSSFTTDQTLTHESKIEYYIAKTKRNAPVSYSAYKAGLDQFEGRQSEDDFVAPSSTTSSNDMNFGFEPIDYKANLDAIKENMESVAAGVKERLDQIPTEEIIRALTSFEKDVAPTVVLGAAIAGAVLAYVASQAFAASAATGLAAAYLAMTSTTAGDFTRSMGSVTMQAGSHLFELAAKVQEEKKQNSIDRIAEKATELDPVTPLEFKDMPVSATEQSDEDQDVVGEEVIVVNTARRRQEEHIMPAEEVETAENTVVETEMIHEERSLIIETINCNESNEFGVSDAEASEVNKLEAAENVQEPVDIETSNQILHEVTMKQEGGIGETNAVDKPKTMDDIHETQSDLMSEVESVHEAVSLTGHTTNEHAQELVDVGSSDQILHLKIPEQEEGVGDAKVLNEPHALIDFHETQSDLISEVNSVHEAETLTGHATTTQEPVDVGTSDQILYGVTLKQEVGVGEGSVLDEPHTMSDLLETQSDLISEVESVHEQEELTGHTLVEEISEEAAVEAAARQVVQDFTAELVDVQAENDAMQMFDVDMQSDAAASYVQVLEDPAIGKYSSAAGESQ